MKISIITTCYNRKNTITDALDSFFAQDYKNKELIVIDGSSKDGSVELIKSYKDKIDYFVSEPDSGIYNALNKGIKKASGDIIGVLHSDDVFYNPKVLSQIAKTFVETQADIVYANGQYVDSKDMSQVKRIYKAANFAKIYLYLGWIPLHTTIFVKKEVFDKFGLYREDFKIASDYEISLRWFKTPKLKKVFLDQWVVKMRLGGESTTMHQQKRKSIEDLKIIKEYKLLGKLTLFLKIAQKVPQYLIPKIISYK